MGPGSICMTADEGITLSDGPYKAIAQSAAAGAFIIALPAVHPPKQLIALTSKGAA